MCHSFETEHVLKYCESLGFLSESIAKFCLGDENNKEVL